MATRIIKSAGIAIGPILFVVALLAVLAGAIAAGSGSFDSNVSTDRSRLAAQSILQTTSQIKFAIQKILASGCHETQLSFENAVVSGYTNPNSPADGRCHVFHPNGGAMTFPETPKNIESSGHRYLFQAVEDVYLTASPPGTDIFLRLRFSDLGTCLELNRMLGNGLPTTEPTLGLNNPCGATFVGSYVGSCQEPHCGTAPRAAVCAPYLYNLSGCHRNDVDPGTYYFYSSIYTR